MPKSKTRLLAGVAIFVSATGAYAQDTSGGQASGPVTGPSSGADTPQAGPKAGLPPVGIEDIVVTARKRSENIQNVPLAVSAVTANELRQKSISTPYQLLSVVPNLSISTGSAARNDVLYFIRGQGTTFAGAPAVVQYFAEVPQQQISASGGANISFYDLESVQVLKGPQGTLFGRSSTGGAVLFTPRKPDGDFDGYAEAGFGNYSSRELTAAVNVPLLDDKIAIRVAANSSYHQGYTKSITTGQDLDDRDRKSFRIGLMLKPTDWLSNYTLFQDQDIHENTTANVLWQINLNNPLLNIPLPRIQAVRDAIIAEYARQQAGGKKTHRTVATAFPDFLRSRSQQFINTTQIDFGEVGFLGDTSLKNIFAAQRQLHSETIREIQGSPVPTGVVYNDLNYNQTTGKAYDDGQGRTKWGDIFSNETQLSGKVNGRHDWIIGYFYERSNRNQYLNWPAVFTVLNGAFQPNAGQPGFSTGFNKDYLLRQTGLFAQTTIDFGDFGLDGVKFTAGWRRSKTLQKLTAVGAIFTPTSIEENPNDPGVKAKDTESEDTYTFALDWKVTSKVLVYVTARRGFKAGGINIQAVPEAGTPGAIPYFQPEIAKDVEIGAKTDWNIGGIFGRTNIALFSSKFSNLQRSSSFITGAGGNASQIANIAASKVKGLEIENNFQITPAFRINVAYSYLDSKYTSYPGTVKNAAGVFVDLIDSPVTGAPKNKLNIGANYAVHLPGEGGTVNLSGDYSYQSRIYTNDESIYSANPKGESQKGFSIVNLRVDWENVMGYPVDLGAYVRNLTDKYYLIGTGGLINTIGTLTRINGDPRTFGMQLRVRFGKSAER